MSTSWSVVIPSDALDHIKKSIPTLLSAHDNLDPKDVVVVSRSLSQDAWSQLKQVTFVRDPEETFNFARRVNLGFQAAEDRDVVVMGDDVEVIHQDSFERLREEAPLRILSPAIRGRVGPWWQKDGSSFAEVPFLSFVCVYIPRMVYEIVGPLDEGFPGYGYEDTDYCIRARRKGLSCGVSAHAVVGHNQNIPSTFLETYREEMSDLERMAREVFAKKYTERA